MSKYLTWTCLITEAGRRTSHKCLSCSIEWCSVEGGDEDPDKFPEEICNSCWNSGDETVLRSYCLRYDRHWEQVRLRDCPAYRRRREAQRKRSRARTWPNRYAHRAKRRAQQKNACPSWVDHTAIAAIFKNCPKGFHVDHVVPLVNDHVCGLHVPWNLQYLPASENLKKSNSFWLSPENPLCSLPVLTSLPPAQSTTNTRRQRKGKPCRVRALKVASWEEYLALKKGS